MSMSGVIHRAGGPGLRVNQQHGRLCVLRDDLQSVARGAGRRTGIEKRVSRATEEGVQDIKCCRES